MVDQALVDASKAQIADFVWVRHGTECTILCAPTGCSRKYNESSNRTRARCHSVLHDVMEMLNMTSTDVFKWTTHHREVRNATNVSHEHFDVEM